MGMRRICIGSAGWLAWGLCVKAELLLPCCGCLVGRHVAEKAVHSLQATMITGRGLP